MRRIIELLASLRLTVALLAFAMALIFLGTIAQTRLGVWEAIDTYFRAPIAWVDPALLAPYQAAQPGDHWTDRVRIPLPGGATIVVLMIVNLVAAHAVRFKASRRRIGIIVLHAGLILLLVGELVTGAFSDEGMMSIDEGRSSSFFEDLRQAELAIVDPSDPALDRVVTVPHTLLAQAAKQGRPISDPRLPFAITVESWMTNAALGEARGPSPATEGIGRRLGALQIASERGVDGGGSDAPAAYLTLHSGGKALGTWLVSTRLIEPQRVETGGAPVWIALRYRRTDLPYTLHLRDFRHDMFTGTTIPKNFSSDIRLVDPQRGVDREVRIWMNNPLRYAGRTFYQASYKPDGSGTVLQVVRNPGWLLPYISCALVAGGMMLHFGMALTGFLRRRATASAAAAAGAAGPMRRSAALRSAGWWLPVVFLCGILIAVSGLFRPSPADDLDLRAFGQIPVSAGGRLKPMDTAARSMLMAVGGRQQVVAEDGRMPATRYLIDLIARPERIADLPVVRVDHPDVLNLLGLAPEDSGRHALSVIEPHWDAVLQQARRAAAIEPRDRDGFQRAVLQLHHQVTTILTHARMQEPYAIPPARPGGDWRPFHDAFLDEHAQTEGPRHPSVVHLASMMTAAQQDDAEAFNTAAHDYLDVLEASMPQVMRKARLETLFNRASLFTGAMAVYILALLGVCASFLLRSAGRPGAAEGARAGSMALLVAAVLVHTAAIAIRIYLQGRPPVTNLYSSAIFVGWASVLAGVVVERLHPLGVAILGSAAIGFGTLVVAHNLGDSGDTMEMMQAVLDSNFWLATHVITITLGYSATFLAAALATVYLLGRVLTRAITKPRERALARMIYGVVCFALLLSFVGTVLGGIWADQSWGRFWGWDPKENGAALVVLINALILHARWGGMIKVRGIAVLAVGGGIVTVWSWFGTNMLGVGLHAYGFMDSAAMWLTIFVASLAGIMLSAALPARRPAGEPAEAGGGILP